jgi:hypothetical protein
MEVTHGAQVNGRPADAGCSCDFIAALGASRKCGFFGQADNVKGREGDEFFLV